MATHGADATPQRAPEIERACPVAREGAARGFRHFLGTPRASQRFRAFGVDPVELPSHMQNIRGLMHRLSRRMDAEVAWPAHGDASLKRWENPAIPSGYTYLLQFVAHDLVQSAIPLSVVGKLGAATSNARRTPLRLEGLYGGGPVASPHLYAHDAPSDDRRTKLRLGRMRWKETPRAASCPFRDIARAQAENVTGVDRNIPGQRPALTEALVADARNDDHAIISQLTAMFALLHNGLIDLVRRGEPVCSANARFGAAYRRFLCARDALTSIYQNIIRKDVMRRVLHPAIYAAYSGANPRFMDRISDQAAGEWQIPFEFSHGAFRFGHAMVRPEYRINDLSEHDLNNTLEKNSVNEPVNMPLDETWMVQWSRFFEINGSRPNFSRRIGPYLSDGLGNDHIFPSFDATERVGLLYRDLLGATLAGMWSVDALIAEIATRRPDFIALSPLLDDRAFRVEQLRQWLGSASAAYGGLTPADIETLANDPPLPFFVLFEAMQQPAQGFHLGLLGSIIVAEVIFGALAVARPEEQFGSLTELSGKHYATDVFAGVPDIECMARLAEFTAETAGLQQAVPAFL